MSSVFPPCWGNCFPPPFTLQCAIRVCLIWLQIPPPIRPYRLHLKKGQSMFHVPCYYLLAAAAIWSEQLLRSRRTILSLKSLWFMIFFFWNQPGRHESEWFRYYNFCLSTAASSFNFVKTISLLTFRWADLVLWVACHFSFGHAQLSYKQCHGSIVSDYELWPDISLKIVVHCKYFPHRMCR